MILKTLTRGRDFRLLSGQNRLLETYYCSVVFLISLVCICSVSSHVTLTFPPARKFPIDFLNNFWTKPPCGMPKGSTRTTIPAGTSFNVNWQLGYSHVGGYKIELLDNKEQKLMDLTEPNDPDGFMYGNATTQWQKVHLPPGLICRDCTLRLLRQVKSFSPDFTFWSCGDVDIVDPAEYSESCYHRGELLSESAHSNSPNSNKCKCRDGYWGRICQFKDECGSDAQCGGSGRGKCLYMGGTNLPRRQCFCRYGWHGEGCAFKNSGEEVLPRPTHSLNLTGHALQVLSERMLMYYRLVEGGKELEIILLVNGTSYAGVGWRPVNLGPLCKSWPFVPEANTINKVESAGRSGNSGGSNGGGGRKNRRIGEEATEEELEVSAWSAGDIFSPMDCQDMIIGAAKGGFSRIRDYYARGRHTPLLDSTWGGSDDISAATGWESNGVTTLIFRRPLRSSPPRGIRQQRVRSSAVTSPGDHDLDQGEMLVVWSRGQETDEVVKDQRKRLEVGEERVSRFYVQDELKYHGLADQRGWLFMDFMSRQSRVPGLNAVIVH